MRSLLSRISPRLWFILVLLIAGGIMAWIEQRDRANEPDAALGNQQEVPDYYAEGATYTRYNDQGEIYQTLTSPRITHTPNDDITHASTPKLTWTASGGDIWHGRGDTGRVEGNGERIILSGHARLHQPDNDWTLSTDTLHYTQQDQHAWSDVTSTFTQADQTTTSNRFDAWIDQDRAVLEGDVKGNYPPTR